PLPPPAPRSARAAVARWAGRLPASGGRRGSRRRPRRSTRPSGGTAPRGGQRRPRPQAPQRPRSSDTETWAW
ncbi:unnamed protein product, partial [Prorocentrum cordatum]